MTRSIFLVLNTGWFLMISLATAAQGQVVDPAMHHLRNTGSREWVEFEEKAQATRLAISFAAAQNNSEYALSLRQYDVKLNWKVMLNGHPLGRLVEDEKDLLCYFSIRPGMLGRENKLEIYTDDTPGDDIKVGEVALYSTPLSSLLSQASVAIEVTDRQGRRLPSRVTIVNAAGILQMMSAKSDGSLAVRPGHVYTTSGQVTVGLPAGTYTLYATRGFEYGVDSVTFDLRRGDHRSTQLKIDRQVETTGWASCDTHIHTFTWSKHGDATSDDRVITIAGEGIELPIFTDHNLHVDLKPVAMKLGVDHHFTAVTGDELTTRVGHFNLFPVKGEKPSDHQVATWKELSENLGKASPPAIILNHARDIHLGFRPFDPSKHLSIAGMRLDGWEFPANAMEVINSGSQQTDQMQLTRDWLGMLNGGYALTPVGSSDSHDVSRFIVGQARTYIRCDDSDVANLDVSEAVKNFVDGNVTVSFGLMTTIEINDTYGPGELAPASDQVKVSVTVAGPRWARAEKVALYANGTKIREATIADGKKAGEKWTGTWELTMPRHDLFFVAVAEGPGDFLPFWPIAKPFQPVSEEWAPKIFGVTGAVWFDGDRNGARNSARDYATDLVRQAGKDVTALIQSLSSFHESVAVQAAALLHRNGKNLRSEQVAGALQRGSGETRAAFEAVIDGLQESEKR